MDRTSVLNGVLASLAVGVAGVGVGLVLDGRDPTAMGMALLAAGFFAASAVPIVRRHDSYGLLSAAYAVAVVGFWGLIVGPDGSPLPALLGVLAVGWLVVELVGRRSRRSHTN